VDAIVGLFIDAGLSLVAMVGGLAGSSEGAFGGVLFGAGAVILLPIMYACFGFVVTFVMAWLYNVLAGLVGGVEIEVQ
jgi:hypothetical protein